MLTYDADIAIVGSGFSGAMLAMIARRLGHSAVLIERGSHPRFAIGESTTPLTNLMIEEIADAYDLPRLRPFSKYGTWKRAYPGVACGLKRGFTFVRHESGAPFAAAADHGDQLMVAASPHDDIGDVHWYRPDFDHFLVREAESMGVTSLDRTDIHTVHLSADGSMLRGKRGADELTVHARLVVDATGPRGFLHRQLTLGDRDLPGLPRTQTLFTHFTGVRRFADVAPAAFAGAPPYPPDDAALHHVFDGGWIWVLRFENGITSAGIAATEQLANDLALREGAAGWARLMSRFPSIGAQFADAVPTQAFTWWPRLSFYSDRLTGDGWVMLPSAAGIVDPLLSTGFPLTLLGIQRVAAIIAESWGTPALWHNFRHYAARSTAELETTARLVGALYDAFGDWERFTALSNLYFAAVSYAESARRIGHKALAGDAFLLGAREPFATERDACLALAARYRDDRTPERRTALLDAIAHAIAPINVAGLADASRHNWYPALADDILASAGKLNASRGEVLAMLARCGFSPKAQE